MRTICIIFLGVVSSLFVESTHAQGKYTALSKLLKLVQQENKAVKIIVRNSPGEMAEWNTILKEIDSYNAHRPGKMNQIKVAREGDEFALYINQIGIKNGSGPFSLYADGSVLIDAIAALRKERHLKLPEPGFYEFTPKAENTVCRTDFLAGTRFNQIVAEKIIGKETTGELSEIKIYLTPVTAKLSNHKPSDKSFIYCYSNFKTPGAQSSTKILYAIDDIGLNFHDYLTKIAYKSDPSITEINQLNSALNDIQVYVEMHLFEKKQYLGLNLRETPNIHIVTLVKGEREVLTPSINEISKIQDEIQFKVGLNPEIELKGQFETIRLNHVKNNLNKLFTLNETESKFLSLESQIENYEGILRSFQKKYDIIESGKYDFLTEGKINSLESSFISKFSLLNENPANNSNLKLIVENYQTAHLLPVSGKLDELTTRKLEEQQKALKNQLEGVIADIDHESLENQISVYRKIKKIENEDCIADEKFLHALSSDANYYINVDGEYRPFEKSDIVIYNSNGEEINKLNTIRYEAGSNVHILVNDHVGNTVSTIDKQLDWKYSLDEMTVFPITENSDTRILLDEQYGKNWIRSSLKNEAEVERKIKRCKRETLFVVGHIEHGCYVEGDFKISIDRLNELAGKYNLNIFHLGCTTAENGGNGTTAAINTYHTVDALVSTIKKHSRFKDFFLDFSNQGIGPEKAKVNLLIDANTFSDKGYAAFKMYQRGGAVVAATSGGAILWYYLGGKK